MTEELNTKNKVVGLKQSRRALQEDTAEKIFLANDASPQIRRELTDLCRRKKVPLEQVSTMKELGAVCGITVGAAVAAIVRAETTDSDGI